MLESYLKKYNTWKPILAILHFCKFISILHRNHSEKSKAIFLSMNSAPSIVKLIIKPKTKSSNTKQKHGQFAKTNDTNKCIKKS